ncbi:hypothetical protein Emed_000558 [Eimeria media]
MDQHRLRMQRASRRLLRSWPLCIKASLFFLLSLLTVSSFANNVISDGVPTALSLGVDTGITNQRDGTSAGPTLHRRLSETADSVLTTTTTSTVSTPADVSTSTTLSSAPAGVLRKWTAARGTSGAGVAAVASHSKSTTTTTSTSTSTSTTVPDESTTTTSLSVPSSTAPRVADPPILPPYPTGAKPAMWPVDEGIITGQGTPHWGTSAMPPRTYNTASFSRDRMSRPPLFSGQGGRIFNNGASPLTKPSRIPSLQPLSALNVQPLLDARTNQAAWPTPSSSSSLRGWLTQESAGFL